MFEVVVGNGARGTVALDNIFFDDGACVKNICDFETPDICGYINDATGKFNWTRNKGPTTSFDTGPSVDHTLGTALGHFMYIE